MIIDFHTHIWEENMLTPGYKEYLSYFTEITKSNNNNYQADPDRLMKDLEEAGIDKSVILIADYSFTSAKLGISIEKYINYVIEKCDEYPDKFIGLVGVDPRHGKKALELIRYGIEQNLKGLVITPTTGFYLNDEMLTPVYDLAQELKIPIVIHDFEQVPRPFALRYIDPLTLDDVLMRYQNIPFIIAPIGLAAGQLIMTIAIRHINHVYGDISGFFTQFLVDKMPDMFLVQPLGMAKVLYGSENILFGSNWPYFENVIQLSYWTEKVKNAKLPLIMRPFGFPSLDDTDRENILGKNTAKLFGLKDIPSTK